MKLNVAVSHKNKNSCYSKAITSMNINSFYFSLPSAAAAAQTSFFTIPNRQVPVSVDFKPFRVSFPFVPNRNF